MGGHFGTPSSHPLSKYILFKGEKFKDFLAIMKYISEFVIPQKKFEDEQFKKIKIRLYNSIQIYYLIQATKQETYEKATEYFENVVKNFNHTDKYGFDELNGLTFSLKGSSKWGIT